MCSYDTVANSWRQTSLPSDVILGSWLSLEDGRVICVGGLDVKTKQVSRQCVMFDGLEGEPRKIGGLTKARMGASLTLFRGFIFAAGGHRQVVSKRKRSTDDKTGQGTALVYEVEPSVEYYVPELDCWHQLPHQPSASPGAKLSLVSMAQPIRLMDISFPTPKGVKRAATEHYQRLAKK